MTPLIYIHGSLGFVYDIVKDVLHVRVIGKSREKIPRPSKALYLREYRKRKKIAASRPATETL